MKHLNRLQLAFSIIPLIFIVTILSIQNFDFFGILMIIFGHIWNWGICHDKIYEKIAMNQKYRFSFLRIYSSYGEFVFNKITFNSKFLNISLRTLLNISLSLMFYLITKDKLAFCLPIGTLLFESSRLLVSKA